VAPFFIIGTERSGSNLLRLILDAHSRLTVPHPPHLVRYFAPLVSRYGDLSDERAFRRLVHDVLRLLDTHIFPWDVRIDAERLVRDASPRDLLGIYVALYEQFRAARGKARWGCKSTFMIDWVGPLLERLPDAQFLFLVRDPRDVAVSSRASVFSTFHPYRTALLWREQQSTGLGWLERLPARSIQLVRYEDLVAEPERVVRDICAFLGESFEPAMLQFFTGEEARRGAELSESWRRTAEPIGASSVRRFAAELGRRELALVESVAGETMRRLGYETLLPAEELARVEVGAIERLRIALAEVALEARVELRSLARDSNALRRWRRGLLLARLRLGLTTTLGGT
jgi:hypothetical protein